MTTPDSRFPSPGIVRVAVGSTSESKLRATRAVFAAAFPGAAVEAVIVSPPVTEQPASDEETIAGALHRAREGRRLADADFGVGIEGGVHQDRRGVWLCAWVAVVDRDGREGLGSGLRIVLPEWMGRRAMSGEPVGDIVDALLGRPEAHEAPGAIGLLTKGLVDRVAALEQALMAALAPFVAAGLYEREPPRGR